jgi:hypothetical protein
LYNNWVGAGFVDGTCELVESFGRWLDLLIEFGGCLIGVRRCLDFLNEFGDCIIIGRWLDLLIELVSWLIVLGSGWMC